MTPHEMTDEQLRVEVAKALGWRDIATRCIDYSCREDLTGVAPMPQGDPWGSYYVVPNYSSDLNAMHKVEKGISGGQWLDYEEELAVHATARQRCIAFLRVMKPELFQQP